MKTPILLWSGMNGTGNDPNYHEDTACVDIWLKRRKLLNELGYDLRILVPRKSVRISNSFLALPVVDYFAREHPDMIVGCPGTRKEGFTDEYDQRVNWPRDILNVIGDYVFVPYSDYYDISSLLLNLNMGKLIVPSRLGEGGFSVGFDHTLVVSEREGRPIEEVDRALVGKLGYNIHMMPSLDSLPESASLKAQNLWRRMSVNGHLDTEMNIVEKRHGERRIFVNDEYYVVFQNNVEGLAGRLNAQIKVIDDPFDIMRKSVNFINLPNGHVILSRDDENMVRLLSDGIGKERVHPIEVFRLECGLDDGSGGLRCRTNFIS